MSERPVMPRRAVSARKDSEPVRRTMAMADLAAAPGGSEEAEEWVVSYMDMVTLLMIVFLTLVGMLWIDKKARPMVVNVLQIETGRMPRADFADTAPVVPPAPPSAVERPLPPNVTIAPETRSLVDRWVAELQRNGLDGQVSLQVQEHRVSLQIRDRLLFPSGQIEIQPGGDRVIQRLAAMLRGLPGVISVEGHTDDVPIHSERFPSNWELSAGRAASVVRALAENGLPAQRLRAVGYADTRPLAQGQDTNSRAQNRRVTLVVEDTR
jgi:chemotaxis protein MotB